METVGVVIPTYGDLRHWGPLAKKAFASVEAQSVPAAVITHQHEETLQQARNMGASNTNTDWLIFLDADDTLDPGYIEGILNGQGDVRQPKTVGIYPDGRVDTPTLIPKRLSFRMGNWIVVGAGVRRELFVKAGGWSDDPILEDMDLWIRCWLAGGDIGTAPEAIYQVHINSTGRNSMPDFEGGKWFNRIMKRYPNL